MRPWKLALGGTVVAALAIMPLSPASADWYYHGPYNNYGYNNGYNNYPPGPLGVVGAVLGGVATIVTAPLAIFGVGPAYGGGYCGYYGGGYYGGGYYGGGCYGGSNCGGGGYNGGGCYGDSNCGSGGYNGGGCYGGGYNNGGYYGGSDYNGDGYADYPPPSPDYNPGYSPDVYGGGSGYGPPCPTPYGSY